MAEGPRSNREDTMRPAGSVAGTLALCLAVAVAAVSAARAEVTIAISCSSLGQEQALCRSGAGAWAKETGNKVTLVSTPADANERLSLYQTLLAAESPDIDVFQIDVVWPGSLASHLVDLRDYIPAEAPADHFQQLIATHTVDDQPVAVPWFVDARRVGKEWVSTGELRGWTAH